jgi:hypothetical protein
MPLAFDDPVTCCDVCCDAVAGPADSGSSAHSKKSLQSGVAVSPSRLLVAHRMNHLCGLLGLSGLLLTGLTRPLQ